MTKIINCECKSEFQDKRYGPGKRVGNLNDKGSATCTVCGKAAAAKVDKK